MVTPPLVIAKGSVPARQFYAFRMVQGFEARSATLTRKQIINFFRYFSDAYAIFTIAESDDVDL